MSGSSKQKGALWYGYLEAGDKSTPVIRDENLDTGNSKTLFLFNLARGQILEYAREVVEPKLRELKPGEATQIAALNAGFGEARRALKHPNVRPLNIPEGEPSAKPTKARDKDKEADTFGGILDSEDEEVWADNAEDEED
ncbi:MAG: hypothetical protein ABR553_07690 [Gammaproteobacteria bacterium]